MKLSEKERERVHADRLVVQVCACGCRQVQFMAYNEDRLVSAFGCDGDQALEMSMAISRTALRALGVTEEMIQAFEAESDVSSTDLVNDFMRRKVSN